MQGDPIKCPHCNSPLLLNWWSDTERRFRCTICGKQTTVKLDENLIERPLEGSVKESPA